MANETTLNMIKNIGVNQFSLGMRIKFIREFRGLTQRELGVMCGFSVSTAGTRIGQYESNEKYPRNDMLLKLNSALNINSNMLNDFDSEFGVSLSSDFMVMLLWASIFGLIVPPLNTDFTNTVVINPVLKSFINSWSRVYNLYQENNITKSEYIEWMLQWPNSKEQ